MGNQHPAATAQQSVDDAFGSAYRAARANGARFTHATEEAGVHRVVEQYAPTEYAAYSAVFHRALSSMLGTKYEGAIAA